MHNEGTEYGMSKIEAQNWVPRKAKKRSIKSSSSYKFTDAYMVQLAIKHYIKAGVLKVFDANGYRVNKTRLPDLVGMTLQLAGGRVPTGEDLTEMVKRYADEHRAAWARVDGSAAIGSLDRIGNKGSRDETGEFLDKQEREFDGKELTNRMYN